MANNSDLSSLDYTNVIRDVHNEPNHALNVIEVNNLVPSRFGRVDLEYITSGNGTGEVGVARYYSDAEYETTKVNARGDGTGSAHKTTLYFINMTPVILDGKVFKLNDNGGSVGVWFNVDGVSIVPVNPSFSRLIPVNILSTDSHELIAQKTAGALSADASFLAMYLSYVVIVSNVQVGLRPNSEDITTNLSIKNTPGANAAPLNNTYFYINSALNAIQYYVWYNVSGTGTDPLIAGKTGIPVAITLGATASQVLVATKVALDLNGDFVTNIIDEMLQIRAKLIGVTTKSTDVTTGFYIAREKEGRNRELLVTLILTYNTGNNLVSVERL